MTIEVPGYKIEGLIAEGGMASVYLAIQESLDRQIALKLLKRFDHPSGTLRFFNEGRIIASLNHRNIITIHDIGVVDERPYIAMEYLRGGDLQQRISAGMAIDAALDLLETLGSCLDFVHRKGIVHRDIKPENILFREDGTPIITDFGIAKQCTVDSSLTLEGVALGSPHYLSPEQATSKNLDGRADLYSLGILFYEMLTGEKPYSGDSPLDIILAHLSVPIPALPPALNRYQSLLEKMIAKDPKDRFENAASLVEAIRISRKGGHCGAKAQKIRPARERIRDNSPLDDIEQPADRQRLPFSRGGRIICLPRLEALPNLFSSFLRFGKTSGWIVLAALILSASLYGIQYEEPQEAPRHVLVEQVQVPPPKIETPPAEDNPVATPPVLEPSPFEEQWTVNSDEISVYLAEADTALREYRLTTPTDHSAYDYYRKVLDLDPFHPAAREGLENIADTYAKLAAAALNKAQHRKAKIYVRRGLAIRPKNSRLLALRTRIDSLRERPRADDSDDPLDFGSRILGTIQSVFE
ncbi:MAG: serine/threonine-protein kinase [Gammaproteobacteria bacterium]